MFLNVLMLMGVGAAVIPLVLHLLSRSRYRNVDWGAMMFLEGVDVRQRQSTRLSQWLLMAVRTALVALLAVALARPVVRRDWAAGAVGAAGAAPRVTAVLLLDASASMGYDENGRTRIELARGAALQVLAALRPGDRAALVTMGHAQADRETRPTTDLREVANRVQAVQPGTGVAGLPEGLERALSVFDEGDPAGPRDVYVIADRQALTWTSADERFQAKWRDRLARAGRPAPRLFALPVGSLASDNVSIDAVTLPNGPAVRGQEAEVEVRLTNRGDARRAALPLNLSLNGAPVARTAVDLAPNAATAVRLPLTFPKAGSQVLTASVKTAGLAADDRYDAAVDVAEPIRVLVLSGDERAGSFRGESDFLRLALAPYASTGAKPAGAGDPADVTVQPADRWRELEPGRFQVVVLANVERFDEQQVRALEQYVYGGGGLLVAPGGLSRPADYNAALYRGGAGILPAELFPPTPADGSGATSLVGYEPNHPIFRFLRGRADPFPNATIGRYFPAGVRQSSGTALAYFLSGDPFLVESAAAAVGRGRVLLMTTPLDADWSNLPLSNFYLPFMQSLVRYLAGGTVEDRNLKPGDPIRVLLDEPAGAAAADAPPAGADADADDAGTDARTATLTRPDRAQPIDLPILPYGAGELRYADTYAPGVYRVTVKDGREPRNDRTVHFVVHPPADESDLAPMSDAQWRWLQDGLNLSRIESQDQAVATAVSSGRDGKELWAPLLGAVLALGVAEVALARRWVRKDE